MQISVKILLVLITFSISILAALAIILVLYFSGLQSIEDEASRLSTSRISLSILKLETKLLKSYDVLQSVTNFTRNRVPNLFESNFTVQQAITQSVRTSAILNPEFSFPAVMTRYANGDVFFLRSDGDTDQTVVAQSDVAFYVRGSTTTSPLDILQNVTRHRFNVTTLTDLPTDDSVWASISVGGTTYVNSENWNVSALRTPAMPSFIQIPPTAFIVPALGRTNVFLYSFAISGYDSPSNFGQLSSAKTMNQLAVFLDFIAIDFLEPFLIDPVRSRAFLVDTRGFENTGSVVSQTHGGLTFEVVNLTNPILKGCYQGTTDMGCFYNISDHPPFALLKKALSGGLPISLPLLNHEIKTLQIEDFTASVGKIVVRDYTPFSFRVYFFTPSDFFTGHLQSALNIAIAISFVIAAVAASVGGYVGVHFALAGVEELAEKMYRDPWQATTTNEDAEGEKSSNNKNNNNKLKVEEVESLQQEFYAFRAAIDMARGFVVASGGGAGVGGNNSDENDGRSAIGGGPLDIQNNDNDNNNYSENSFRRIDDDKKDEHEPTVTETYHDTTGTTAKQETKRKNKRVQFVIEPPSTLSPLDDDCQDNNHHHTSRNNKTRDIDDSILTSGGDPSGRNSQSSPKIMIKIKQAPTNYVLVACIKFMVLTSSSSSKNNNCNKPSDNTNNNNNNDNNNNNNNERNHDSKPSSSFSTSSTNNTNDDSMMNSSSFPTNRQLRSASLLDVHSYFRVLDRKKKKMEQEQQSPAVEPVEDKILLGRILSSACNVLLQSSGLSLIQFFGDSMLCYFRVRSAYNNSRMVIKFIANICKLQQRLGEGNYHELFKNYENNNNNSNNNCQESTEEQNVLDRQQEFKIEDFLGKNLLSTTNVGDVQSSNTQNSAENSSISLSINYSQSESGPIDEYAAEGGREQQLQQHTHDSHHDNFFLKICAGISISQAFILAQQDCYANNRTKSSSTTPIQPTRAVTVLGAAVSNAKTLCEEAPQLFCQSSTSTNQTTKSSTVVPNEVSIFEPSTPLQHQHDGNNNNKVGFALIEEAQYNDDGIDSRNEEGGTSRGGDNNVDDIPDVILGGNDDDDVAEENDSSLDDTRGIRRSMHHHHGVLESMEGTDVQGLSPKHPIIAVPYVFREIVLIPEFQRTKNSLRTMQKRLPVLDIASLKKMKARESEYDLLGALGHHQAHTSYLSALDALREKYLSKQRGENKTPDGDELIPLEEFKSNLKVKVVRLLLSPEQ